MSLDIHTVSVLSGSNALANPDRLKVLLQTAVATAAGGGAGATVTLAVTGLDLPASYNVQVTPNQDAVCYVAGKTQAGFTVHINPRLAANTLAAGTVDILVTA